LIFVAPPKHIFEILISKPTLTYKTPHHHRPGVVAAKWYIGI